MLSGDAREPPPTSAGAGGVRGSWALTGQKQRRRLSTWGSQAPGRRQLAEGGPRGGPRGVASARPAPTAAPVPRAGLAGLPGRLPATAAVLKPRVRGVVPRRPSQSPDVTAPRPLPRGSACAPSGRLSPRESHTGQYLGSNESFIHGFRPVLGQKQRELVQQARSRLLHGSLSAAPQGGESAARQRTCAVLPASGRREAETRTLAGKSSRVPRAERHVSCEWGHLGLSPAESDGAR